MKRVIITADDLGKSQAINQGIERGHREGLITSASLLVNGKVLADALHRIEGVPGLDVGLHLNLVEGRPISRPDKVPTLIHSEKGFHPGYRPFLKAFYRGKIAMADLEREIRAQIEKFLEYRGLITHLDSHQHLHFQPQIWRLLIQLCQEYPIKALRWPVERSMPGLPKGSFLGGWAKSSLLRLAARRIREQGERSQIKIPDHFIGLIHGGKMTSSTLRALLGSVREGITEIMTHPGIENDPARKSYRMREELEALTDPEVRREIREKGIELISFRDWVSEERRLVSNGLPVGMGNGANPLDETAEGRPRLSEK